MHPIDLLNRKVNNDKKKNKYCHIRFMVYLNYFRKILSHSKFNYDHSDFIWVDVDSVICTMTIMSFDVERDVFEFNPVDGNSLNEFVEKST